MSTTNSAQGCYTKEKKSWWKLLQPLMSVATLLYHLAQLEEKLEISQKAIFKKKFFLVCVCQLNLSVLKNSALTRFVFLFPTPLLKGTLNNTFSSKLYTFHAL